MKVLPNLCKKIVGMLGCIVFLGILPVAFAYELAPLNWSHQQQPVHMAFTICVRDSMQKASGVIKRAAKQWRRAGMNLHFTYDSCHGDSGFPSVQANGISRIDFGTIQSGRIAETTTHGNAPRAQECDIRFSRSVPWHLGRGVLGFSEFDLYSVALHEFGHCLGLGHSTIAGTVMFDTTVTGYSLRTLQEDDLAGIRALYDNDSRNPP